MRECLLVGLCIAFQSSRATAGSQAASYQHSWTPRGLTLTWKARHNHTRSSIPAAVPNSPGKLHAYDGIIIWCWAVRMPYIEYLDDIKAYALPWFHDMLIQTMTPLFHGFLLRPQRICSCRSCVFVILPVFSCSNLLYEDNGISQHAHYLCLSAWRIHASYLASCKLLHLHMVTLAITTRN